MTAVWRHSCFRPGKGYEGQFLDNLLSFYAEPCLPRFDLSVNYGPDVWF